MLHRIVPSDQAEPSTIYHGNYRIVALYHTLPAFDPLLMVKTIILGPVAVKKFNHFMVHYGHIIQVSVIVAYGLRLLVFAVSASMGRILAPVATVLHLPCMVAFVLGMRVEYVKILAHTFDFWFTQLANMLWAITFSVVLMDLRVTLVVVYSLYFTNSLFQETNLGHSTFMTLVSLGELCFCLLLTVWLSLGLVDEVHHDVLFIARGRMLSTKDILVNALGTMAMLSLRHTHRRYIHAVHQKNTPGAPMQAQGYRCKIALSAMGPCGDSTFNDAKPSEDCNANQQNQQRSTDQDYKQHYSKLKRLISRRSKATMRPLLQMNLVTGYGDIDPYKTVWPRIGTLTCIATWKSVVLYSCGVVGAGFAALSLFLPSNSRGTAVISVVALMTSFSFSGVHFCCSQRQLLKSIVTSFNYLFLMFQVFTIGICVADMLSWHWVSTCGVICSWILAHTVLTVDALTPTMKHRLRFKYWLIIGGIVLFWLIHAGLLLDVLVLGNLNLQDRVFLDFAVLGRQCQFHVAPFLFSRVVTVLVWAARYVVVALTGSNNTLVLLRGNVEFDYESWKTEAKRKLVSPRT